MVMIDEDSASASEIFAGAIRDQNRGLIVGRTSYGKGSVQGVFQNELSEGGIRLTISKFFSPAGHAISARGIEPHVNFDSGERYSAKPQIPVGKLAENDASGKSMRMQTSNDGKLSNAPQADDEDVDLLHAIDIAKFEFAKIARLR